MDRRRGTKTRPVSSEEVDCWSQAAESLTTLSTKYSSISTLETIERVNRLISAWPTDDMLPAEGLDGVKTVYSKLQHGLRNIQTSADDEFKAIEAAIERLDILIGLRTASSEEKRPKRPRAPSLSGTPVPVPAASVVNGRSSVSITLPARTSVGPSSAIPFARDLKSRRGDLLAKQLPLQEGRSVAFHPPPGTSANGTNDNDENTWILALVTRCLSAEKHKYEVQDAEPPEDGEAGIYTTTLKSLIPLPDPKAPPGSPSHVSSYPEFAAGSIVLALYPDTSCLYRAEVIATPKDLQPAGRAPPSSKPMYKLKFEDDDGQEHTVSAQFVVEWPNSV